VTGATAIGTAFGAIETFMENLAFEISPSGVRALCLRITANIDTRTIQDTMHEVGKDMNTTEEQKVQRIASLNWLKLPASVHDTANELVFLASDKARFITGTVINASAGAAMD
jgi:NAD(P)-dependent dehydrogenase (short-subunit alcohol dehydrogenase family)